MASLWKHPRSRYWTACFTAVDGQRLKKTTRKTDKKAAQKIADEYEATARGEKTASQVMKTVLELHQRFTGQAVPVLTVRAFLADWMEGKKKSTSAASVVFYQNVCDRFLESLGEAAEKPIMHVTQTQVRRFWLDVANGRTQATAKHYFKCLRMIFKSALLRKAVAENPTDGVELGKGRTKPAKSNTRRPFTLEELRKVMLAADDEWRSMVIFAFYSGQRLSDIGALTWGNLDLDRQEISLTTRKTGKEIKLPLAAPLLRHILLLERGKPETPLHPRAYAVVSAPGSNSALSNQFVKILAAAGLRAPVTHDSTGRGRCSEHASHGLSFHSIRHTARTLLEDARIPTKHAMAYIGHDDIATSNAYAHVGRAALLDAANALPEL
ncbi:MAG TPA: tyrosine-type recombinase/integrase [Verrucomicrobiales bacterium]|nr:tyrosine-type recombinase/integrase [Verrucomicrobiales bacterium]